jgi:hypothetical protein
MGVFTKNNEKFESKNEIQFEGNKKEEELEQLLIDNPNIFPVNQIAEASTWIPLGNQIGISNHGKLDILSTDNAGNIYVVECKIKGNQDMKTIRGQITDYVAGLWREKDSWESFTDKIKKSSGKKLEEILNDNIDEDIEDTVGYIKENFENGRYFLVYAVDQINPGLRDVVSWHNEQLDQEHQYPSFALEVKKYSGDNNSEFIVTQNFPFNLNEIRRKKEKTESRSENTKEDWKRIFEQTEINDQDRNRILEFAKRIEDLISKDGGKMTYGRGRHMPRMMPKFDSTILRSGIGLNANGKLSLQFHLLGGEYPAEAEIFKKNLLQIEDIKKVVEKSKTTGNVGVESKIWLPHMEKILSIIEEVFLKKIS